MGRLEEHATAPARRPSGIPLWAKLALMALFGGIALYLLAHVAFRLVAVSASDGDEPGEQHYFNTGTFRRLGDGWRAVAWQATRIPGSE